MSRGNGNGPNAPKLDLRLNLSPPRVTPRVQASRPLPVVPPVPQPNPAMAAEPNPEGGIIFSNSPDAVRMKVVGCPHCFMYIMIAEDESRCPRCKSTDVIDKFTGSSSTANQQRN